MASKKLKGITVEIGGDTTKLSQALQASTQKSNALTSELKQVNSALKFNPDSLELLSQKQAILTERVEATSEQLEILKNAEAQVQRQFENGDIGANQYREFQRELITTESRLSTFTNQLEECQQAIDQLGSETNSTVRDIDKLTSTIAKQEDELTKLADEYVNVVLSQGKNSDEAKELSRQISALNEELGENKSKLNDAQDEAKKLATNLDRAGDSADESSDGFTVMKGAIAGLVTEAITSAIGAIGDLIGSLLDLTEASEEYRQMQAKLEGSADSFGYSMEFAGEKYKELYAYVGDDQMATNAITNLMGIKLETEDLEGIVDGAIATWSAYGDSIPIESLTESIAETINVSKVTGTFADTINWATLSNEQWVAILGKGSEAQKAFNKAIKDGEAVEDAFNSALEATSSQQERSRLVANLLNQTYGESKKTYDELGKSIIETNKAELELKETQAEIGEALSPVNMAIMEMKTSLLDGLVPAFKELSKVISGEISFDQFVSDMGPMVQQGISSLSGAIPSFISKGMEFVVGLSSGFAQGFPLLLESILSMIQNIGDWLTENAPFLIQKGYEMLSNLIQGITDAIPVLIERVPEIISTFANVISDNFPTILAKGAELLWQLVTGIIGAIPTLIANIPQIITAIVDVIIAYNWIGLGKNIIQFFGNGISSMVSSIGAKGGEIFNAIWNAVKNLPQTLLNLGKSMITNMGNAITNATGTVKGAIKGVFDAIWNGIKSLPSKMLDIGKNIVEGLWDGIKGAGKWLEKKVKGFADGVVGGIKDFFGIHSPSRVFRDEVGKFIAEGIGVGIAENANYPIDAITDLEDDLINQANGINGLTINRQLETTFPSSPDLQTTSITELVRLVSDYFPKLIEASKHAIVLDSGTLVGETINQTDEALALQYLLKERRV